MSLFKKSELKKLRSNLVKEVGGDISDDGWDKVVKKVEDDYREILKKELPKAFWFAMFEVAEKSDCIIEIDGENLGEKLRYLKRLPPWLVQKKLYFGW